MIHIIGPSGSGKSTLGRKLARHSKFLVIELDDIDDDNALILLRSRKYSYLFEKDDMSEFFSIKDKMNQEDVDNIIKNNSDKTLIFIGLNINIKTKHVYCVKTDGETLYRNYSVRTLKELVEHNKAITKLFRNKKYTTNRIQMLMIYKYNIRGPMYGPNVFFKEVEYWKQQARKHRYKLRTTEEIYDDILSKFK